MLKKEVKERAKEILRKMFCNSFTWMEDEDLTEGLTSEEIEEIDNQLDKYIKIIYERLSL